MGRREGDKERRKLWETPSKPKFTPKPILDEIRADDEITGNPLLDEPPPGGEFEEYTTDPGLLRVDEFAIPLNFQPDEALLSLLRSGGREKDQRSLARSKSVIQACIPRSCGCIRTTPTRAVYLPIPLADLQAARHCGRHPCRGHDDREHPANA